MATKYEKELSPKDIMALGRRNHIVQDILISLALTEGSNRKVWHKTLMVMVLELVEYCERVTIEGYDQYLSNPEHSPELSEEEKEKVRAAIKTVMESA